MTVTGETPVVDVQSAKREVTLRGDVIENLPGHARATARSSTPSGRDRRCERSREHADHDVLHGARRQHQRRPHDDQRHGGRRVLQWRRRLVARLRREQRRGSLGRRIRRHGRERRGRAGDEPRAEVRRQHGSRARCSGTPPATGRAATTSTITCAAWQTPITLGPGIIGSYDFNPSYGGPIQRDRLWFWAAYRKFETAQGVEGDVREQVRARPGALGLPEGTEHPGAQRPGTQHLPGASDRAGDAEEPRDVFPRIPAAVRRVDADPGGRGMPRSAATIGSASVRRPSRLRRTPATSSCRTT